MKTKFLQRVLWLLIPLLTLITTSAWGAADETITFSSVCSADESLHNMSKTGANFSVYFNKGTNSNAPVYKTTGAAVRVYGGGYFTVSSATKTITRIDLTFGSGDGSNSITTDEDTYGSGTWSGTASSVTFTIGGTSGHRRIASVAVTYASGCTGTKLGTPDVTATPSDRQIVLSWPAVEHASSYQLKWNGGDWAAATSPVTKSTLTNGTAYTYQVKAIGNGNTYCDGDASEEASATPNNYHTVTWQTHDGVFATTQVVDGQKPTFPADPAACDETSTTFIGWSTAPWSGKLDNLTGKTVHTSNSTMSNITDNGTEFYAVWAKGNMTANRYKMNNSGTINSSWEKTNDRSQSSSSYAGVSYVWQMFGAKNSNPEGEINTTSTYSNVSAFRIKVAASATTDVTLYYSNSNNKDSWISVETKSVSQNTSSYTSYSYDVSSIPSSAVYLKIKNSVNSLYVDSIIITTGAFADYMTTCCEHIVPAPEVTGTSTKNTITLSWDNVTGANGYTVTCSGGTPGEVTSSGNNRTCEITGLSPNTAYTWTVVATYDSPYCQATAANGSTTTKQVYTVSYNKNGGTIANLPSGGSYAAGETVTVAAKPDGDVSKGGYEFTGWNTAATPSGSSTHYDADGTATFTMQASAVTLYAEWTAKKNYFVDRMHGNCDGEHTITIGGTVYNCYLREGQSYTVPDLSDNSTGSNTCVTGHSRFIGWVAAGTDGKSGKIGAQGQLVDGYTVVQGGTTRTARDDGMIYYAVWAEE